MEMVLMLGMMLMMISMMPVTMMMTMTTTPLPGGDLPAGICPPEMAFLLCRFPPRGGGETRKLFFIQGFYSRGSYRREGRRGGPPGIHDDAWHDQEVGRARHPSGCLVGPLTSILG